MTGAAAAVAAVSCALFAFHNAILPPHLAPPGRTTGTVPAGTCHPEHALLALPSVVVRKRRSGPLYFLFITFRFLFDRKDGKLADDGNRQCPRARPFRTRGRRNGQTWRSAPQLTGYRWRHRMSGGIVEPSAGTGKLRPTWTDRFAAV